MSEAQRIPTREQIWVRNRHIEDLKRMDAFIERGWPTDTTSEPVDMGSMVTLAMSTSSRSSVLLLAVGVDSKFTHNTLSLSKDNRLIHPWLIEQDAKENRALATYITEEWKKMVVPNGQRQQVDTIAKYIVYNFSDDKKLPEMVPLECDKKANVRVLIEDLEIWSHPRRDEPLKRVLEKTKGFTQDRGYFVKIYPNSIRNIIQNKRIKDKEKRLITAKEKCGEKFDIFYSKYYCELKAIPTSYEFPTIQLELKTGGGQPSKRYGGTFSGWFSAKANKVHQKFPVDEKLPKWPLPTKENVFDELMKCAESVYEDVRQDQFWLENEMVRTIPYRKFQKLLGVG